MTDLAWTPEREERHQEQLAHMRTCDACELRNADDSSRLCPEMERMLAPATEMKIAGAQPLPGFESVAARPADGAKSWSA